MENEYLALDKIFSWLKSHFPSISQADMYFFSLWKKILSGQKSFVQADGPGINELMNYRVGHIFLQFFCLLSFHHLSKRILKIIVIFEGPAIEILNEERNWAWHHSWLGHAHLIEKASLSLYLGWSYYNFLNSCNFLNYKLECL